MAPAHKHLLQNDYFNTTRFLANPGTSNPPPFVRPRNLDQCQNFGWILAVQELHFTADDWLTGMEIAIADLAAYPCFALSLQSMLSTDGL